MIDNIIPEDILGNARKYHFMLWLGRVGTLMFFFGIFVGLLLQLSVLTGFGWTAMIVTGLASVALFVYWFFINKLPPPM